MISGLPGMVWIRSMISPFSRKIRFSIRDTPLEDTALCGKNHYYCILSCVPKATWSLVNVFPLRVAVVSTLVPSPVVSGKGTPNSKSIEVDLKVEEVSMPTVSPPKFLFVAVG